MSQHDYQVEDLAIVSDLFCLAKSGRFNKGKHLFDEAKRLYPNESEARLRQCIGKLVR